MAALGQNRKPLEHGGEVRGTLRLVGFVEEHYGIEVEAHEASIENFDSIQSIVSFIEAKKGLAI